MIKIKSKDVKAIIKATFPNYRKRDVYVKETDKVTLWDLNWSGGTRSEYRACTIEGKPLQNAVDMSLRAPWDNPYEGKEIKIPEGYVVVEGGHFCGKPRNLYINVNPGNVKLITG